jgi:hypothetical protein
MDHRGIAICGGRVHGDSVYHPEVIAGCVVEEL